MKAILAIFLLIIGVTVGGLALVTLVLLYSPGLQHRIVLKELKQQFGEATELEHLHFGVGMAEIRGLKLTAGQESLSLGSLDARYAFWKLLQGRVELENFNVQGLDIDIAATGGADLMEAFSGGSEPDPAGENVPSASEYAGLPLHLQRLAIDGLVRLPESRQVEFSLLLEGLVPGATATGDATVKLSGSGAAHAIRIQPEVTLDADSGEASLKALILLSSPETVTTASLSARINPADPKLLRFDVEVTADEFSPDEWQPLLALLPQDADSGERDPAPDTQPPWAGLDGQIVARLGLLRLGNTSLTGISAKVQVLEGQRVISDLEGTSGTSPISMQAELVFNPATAAMPYALDGRFNIQKLAVEPFLRAPQSTLPVILEGVFNASGQYQSAFPNLDYLADGLTGDILLQSDGGGIFRPLGEKTSIAQGVSSILGVLTGSVRELGWVQQVIDQLQEIPYTRMSFSMAREPGLDLVLRDLDLVSRETRIRGQGIIQHQAGAALASLPIDMNFQLHAKGRLAEALRTGGQIRSEQPDDLGFLPGPPLPLRGSLAQPESMLVNLLMDSGQQLLPGLLRPKSAPQPDARN